MISREGSGCGASARVHGDGQPRPEARTACVAPRLQPLQPLGAGGCNPHHLARLWVSVRVRVGARARVRVRVGVGVEMDHLVRGAPGRRPVGL